MADVTSDKPAGQPTYRYVAVNLPPDDGAVEQLPDDPTNRLMAWMFLFLVNLPVPFMFGLATVHTAVGVFGMLLGIISGLALTTWVVLHFRALARPLIIGAAVVGISQLIPVLHIIAGSIALSTWNFFNNANGSFLDNRPMYCFTGGFLLTLLTGQLLLLAAVIIGGIGVAIGRWFSAVSE